MSIMKECDVDIHEGHEHISLNMFENFIGLTDCIKILKMHLLIFVRT